MTAGPERRLGAAGSRIGSAGGDVQIIRFCCHTRAACPDRDLGVAACRRWRVNCHTGAAPGRSFSYVSSGRMDSGIARQPTPGPAIHLREPGQCFAAFLAFFPLRLTLPAFSWSCPY
jgi:hypothetical protein